jgi:hypothetical protein
MVYDGLQYLPYGLVHEFNNFVQCVEIEFRRHVLTGHRTEDINTYKRLTLVGGKPDCTQTSKNITV